MAEFGLRTLLSTSPNSTATMAASFGFSAAGTFDQVGTVARFHTAGAGETVTGLGVNAKNNGGVDANFAMALYEYTPSGDAAVFGTMGARVAYEVAPFVIPNDDTFREHLVTLSTPFEMVEGTTYITAIATDLTQSIIVIAGPERAQANSTERDFDAGLYGGLQDPWAGATLAGGADPAIFAEYTIADGSAPTLTTPYSTIVLDLGATGSIDLSTNWSGASTFNITQLPNWMTQVGDTGVVNYADTSWGGQYSNNSIGGGKWFMEVEAIDATGLLSASTGIWVYIRP